MCIDVNCQIMSLPYFLSASSLTGGCSKYHIPSNRRDANMHGSTFTFHSEGNTSKKYSRSLGCPRQKNEVPLPVIITT